MLDLIVQLAYYVLLDQKVRDNYFLKPLYNLWLQYFPFVVFYKLQRAGFFNLLVRKF